MEVPDNTLDTATSKLLTYPEMLEQLLGSKMAHFPFQRTLEQFDFAFQPSTDQRQVKELANLAFVAEATNILMLGPPGVVKTDLAVALAEKTIKRGYGAYFARAYELMRDLGQEKTGGIYTSGGLALPRVHNGWERQAFWFQTLPVQMTNAAKPGEPL